MAGKEGCFRKKDAPKMMSPYSKIPLWPGEPPLENQLDRILRVDLAGEKGAQRIYEGQLWILKDHPIAAHIQHMYMQECSHTEGFEKRIRQAHGRPTFLSPLWHIAGFSLGAFSALLGHHAAMACTVAVEEVIDGHYAGQIQQIRTTAPSLSEFLEKCRLEEVSHRDEAASLGAFAFPLYTVFSAFVRTATRLAVALSERI